MKRRGGTGDEFLFPSRINPEGHLSTRQYARLRTLPTSRDVKDRITAAFRRQANLDATTVTVRIDGGKVTLDGRGKAWSDRGIAERAAWAAPGVTKVEDNIVVT
jgi:osmotically-inducible protein OsmY